MKGLPLSPLFGEGTILEGMRCKNGDANVGKSHWTISLPFLPKNNITVSSNKQTIHIAGDGKNKIRPGDILGALTAGDRIPGSAIGRIDILDFGSFVAIDIAHIADAIAQLENRRIKGQKFKVRRLHTIATRSRR